ncbi:MAG: cobalamin B12-binding domain-containing protein [Calditrichaceae bacterium]|jgi:methylmalonyl-CoA mutase C-terminal domain/subunit
MSEKIRILVAKPGLDGHDRGAKYIARALKDAGYEVIYTGIRQSPEAICKSAIQEDVDFVGLSLLSGAHNELFPKIVSLIRQEGGDNIIVFGGGVIPRDDIARLKEQGVEAIFTPGTPIKDVIEFIESNRSRISH